MVQAFARKRWQPLLQKLYLFSVTGLNYGNANRFGFDSTGEKKAVEYIAGLSKNNSSFVFFDVGANGGSYSEMVASVFKNPDLKIFAFEPSRFSFPNLKEKTSEIPCMQVFNFGLGSSEEDVQIFANYEGSGATSLYKTAIDSLSKKTNIEETIHLTTIDKFCPGNNIRFIDFMKIDVEGHELFVLNGAQKMLQSKSIRFIQFEFGSFHVFSRTFFKDFWDLLSPSYRIYRIVCDGIVEIKSYSENLEIFRTANFLAELKN